MQILTELLTNLTALLDAEGDFSIGLDLPLSKLIGDLQQVAQFIDAPPGIDLDELIPEQVLSHAKALTIECRAAHTKCSELQSSCEALGRTIQEQSDTLENRAKVVTDLEFQVTEQQKIVEAARFNIEQKEKAMLETVLGESVTPQQFAEALDVYSLAVARISSTEAHPQIVVALVQMAMHMRGLENMTAVLSWLRGSQ